MKTKHTSKTLQERLERLSLLRTHQVEIKAFLADPTIKDQVEFQSTRWKVTLAKTFMDQAAELQYEANQYEIAEILEELRLEE